MPHGVTWKDSGGCTTSQQAGEGGPDANAASDGLGYTWVWPNGDRVTVGRFTPFHGASCACEPIGCMAQLAIPPGPLVSHMCGRLGNAGIYHAVT